MYTQKKDMEKREQRAAATSGQRRKAGAHPDKRYPSPIYQFQSEVHQLEGKELPDYLYRWDPLKPEAVAELGLPQRYAEGTATLEEHVRGSDNTGKMNYMDSQWMSTGEWGMIEKIDPLLAQKGDRTLYKIDPKKAQEDSKKKFINVEEYYRGKDKKEPYPDQHEWGLEGRISPESIVGYMDRKTLMKYYGKTDKGLLDKITVSELELGDWKPLPPRPDKPTSYDPKSIRMRK